MGELAGWAESHLVGLRPPLRRSKLGEREEVMDRSLRRTMEALLFTLAAEADPAEHRTVSDTAYDLWSWRED